MRTPLALLSSLVVLALADAPAIARDRTAATPAAAPAASMSMDCSSGAMKRHDHGGERGAPSSKSKPCAPQAASSSAKSRAKPSHDHAKFHKNQ